jgi:syntaxin 16
MATRNLTKNFNELRQQGKSDRGGNDYDDSNNDRSLLSESGANYRSMKDSLPPLWIEKIEQAEEDITKIQSKMKDLVALHNKRLMVDFESDEAEQERRIEDETGQITGLFRHAESVLKKFGAATAATGSSSDKTSEAEHAVRSNIQRNMAKRLQQLSVAFRTQQKEYLTKVRAQAKGVALDIFDNKPAQAAINDTGFTSEQMRIVDDTSALVDERDQEIVKIAKNIEELAGIFKELSAMVIDQGTILDRIDYNMETTVEHTKEGLAELVKAEDHQKANLGVKCIIVLAVLIFAMVLVLIFKHRKK